MSQRTVTVLINPISPYVIIRRILTLIIRTERGRLITVMYFIFHVVMYVLFVLSVHVYYVNCNAKTKMGYLCALIK